MPEPLQGPSSPHQAAHGPRQCSSRALSNDQQRSASVLAARAPSMKQLKQVAVFSSSHDAWFDGKVVEVLEGGYLRVEFLVKGIWHGKNMHLESKHLRVAPTPAFAKKAAQAQSEDEADPDGMFDRAPQVYAGSSKQGYYMHMICPWKEADARGGASYFEGYRRRQNPRMEDMQCVIDRF
eukprot:TRINITY_DN49522_c0_g1_i1.p1 TRINITY_DN49522_c0_g1~~TRINITY_DN49522_c0_g1_i1.p1  ORF type:complete len:180 (+),score=35.54 TRINITY_DN49522_c0_g1_i1:97-636(+)